MLLNGFDQGALKLLAVLKVVGGSEYGIVDHLVTSRISSEEGRGSPRIFMRQFVLVPFVRPREECCFAASTSLALQLLLGNGEVIPVTFWPAGPDTDVGVVSRQQYIQDSKRVTCSSSTLILRGFLETEPAKSLVYSARVRVVAQRVRRAAHSLDSKPRGEPFAISNNLLRFQKPRGRKPNYRTEK